MAIPSKDTHRKDIQIEQITQPLMRDETFMSKILTEPNPPIFEVNISEGGGGGAMEFVKICCF